MIQLKYSRLLKYATRIRQLYDMKFDITSKVAKLELPLYELNKWIPGSNFVVKKPGKNILTNTISIDSRAIYRNSKICTL